MMYALDRGVGKDCGRTESGGQKFDNTIIFF